MKKSNNLGYNDKVSLGNAIASKMQMDNSLIRLKNDKGNSVHNNSS